MHIELKGILGYHDATIPSFSSLYGEGWVLGKENIVSVKIKKIGGE
jgi:hypothetical protein